MPYSELYLRTNKWQAMAELGWQKRFSPRRYLSSIQIESILPKNILHSDNAIHAMNGNCYFCGLNRGIGLVLSDKSKLCVECFNVIQYIELPEKYESIKRTYLLDHKAWSLAKYEFEQDVKKKDFSDKLFLYGFYSLFISYFGIKLLSIGGTLLIVGIIVKSVFERRRSKWENQNPEPKKPLLKGFHEASEELTEYDKKVLKIFVHWPGYPPFWKSLREDALRRDGYKCQINGCPSRLSLHVHHIKAISNGGAHVRSNLVSLCELHHALQPEDGHKLIWEDIKNEFFTYVRNHQRMNRTGSGYHDVKPHLRRLKLIDIDEIKDICKYHSLSCHDCGSGGLSYKMSIENQIITVNCKNCGRHNVIPRLLTEETGPLFCLSLKPVTNVRSQFINDEMLSRTYDNVSPTKKGIGKRTKTKNENQLLCKKCGSRMVLRTPPPNKFWQPFYGCSSYPECKFTMRQIQ